jgi:hypothetical protein
VAGAAPLLTISGTADGKLFVNSFINNNASLLEISEGPCANLEDLAATGGFGFVAAAAKLLPAIPEETDDNLDGLCAPGDIGTVSLFSFCVNLDAIFFVILPSMMHHPSLTYICSLYSY